MSMLINRRELIARGSAGLAGIIAAGKSPAAVVRSMLGAGSTKYIATGGHDFPYVKKGLVAMWDGEWNDVNEDGELYHNPSATTWKNIANPDVYGLPIPISATWEDNRLVSNTPVSYVYYPGRIEPILTQEVVFLCESSYSIILLYAGTHRNRRMSVVRNGAYLSRGSIQGIQLSGECATYSTVYSSAEEVPGVVAQLVNGQAGTPSTVTDSWDINNSQTFFLSRNKSYGFKGYIHCIRLYEIALTTQQIFHNYEVDKERFKIA